jgi:hypothetical protein
MRLVGGNRKPCCWMRSDIGVGSWEPLSSSCARTKPERVEKSEAMCSHVRSESRTMDVTSMTGWLLSVLADHGPRLFEGWCHQRADDGDAARIFSTPKRNPTARSSRVPDTGAEAHVPSQRLLMRSEGPCLPRRIAWVEGWMPTIFVRSLGDVFLSERLGGWASSGAKSGP